MSGRDFPPAFLLQQIRHISATSARRERRNRALRALFMCSQREADTVRRALLMRSQKEADTARRALLMCSQKEADTVQRALSMCSQKRQTQKAQNTKAAAGHRYVSRRRVFFQFVSSKLICVMRAISSSGMLPSRMTELQCSLFI